MKLFSTTLLVLLSTMFAWSQTEIVSLPRTGLGMTIDGDDLYVAANDKIYYVDLSASEPEAKLLMENLGYIISMQIVGTDLYLGDFDKIYKVDLTAATLDTTSIVSGLAYVRGFLLDGTDLYFTQQNGSKVSKIDLTATTPTVVDLVSDLGSATGLAKRGDTLYVTQYGVRKIAKIDLTANPIVAEDFFTTTNAPSGIIAVGNFIYFSEFDADEGSVGQITRVDVTGENAGAEVLASGFNVAWDVVPYGCNLLYDSPSSNSVMELKLTTLIDYSTTTMGNTITAEETGVSYQWINCEDDSPIEGETAQSFEASKSGDYAVIITSGTCSDTSDCVNLTFVGTENPLFNGVSIYPVPAQDLVSIDLGGLENVALRVFDTRGQLVHSNAAINTAKYQFDLSTFSAGLYIVELTANNNRHQYKLMVE